MSYDPAFLNTASLPQRDHLDRRRQGRALVPRHPDRAALRAEHLPRGRLPARLRRAADRGPARRLDPRHHAPHLRPREHQEVRARASATTRTRWGCCSHPSARSRPSIPDAKHIKDPEERYMATIRMIAKMPTLAAFAYRHNLGLPYVYPDNDLDYPGNFLSMMFKMTELKYEPGPAAGAGARRALDPARRPRAELLDQRGPRRRLVAGGPVLGGRGRRRGALRAAPRRRQRGGAEDARPDRHRREHPRLPRGREGAARSA